jgi:hypothetical protein
MKFPALHCSKIVVKLLLLNRFIRKKLRKVGSKVAFFQGKRLFSTILISAAAAPGAR